jgi:hypothetical protein
LKKRVYALVRYLDIIFLQALADYHSPSSDKTSSYGSAVHEEFRK